MYDVIIIGGGSAGLMAAIAASSGGQRVLLLEKGDKLGRKLGISGGGRCNVTNNKEIDELIRHIPGNGRFLYSAFSHFNNKDIIAFFENLGIRLKEEDNGRMFPVSDKAKTVVDTLVNQVRKQGVQIKLNVPVEEVLYKDGKVSGVLLKNGEALKSRSVIIASGGRSVPQTGSTGDGYAWAQKAGHTITELFPTEVPLTSNDPFIQSKELQGLSLRDVALAVWNPKGKKLIEHRGDMLFTHFGISGPIALRCSQFVVKALKQFGTGNIEVSIDLLPDKSKDDIYSETLRLAEADSRKSVKNVLKGYLPEKMIPYLLQQSGVAEAVTFDHIPKQEWMNLAQVIKRFPIRVYGTLSIEEAFVTGGGVNLKEIDPKTMESKLMQGLYFCGEVLDIHGYTGGYNITAAFSTGYTAGRSAVEG
ncbi:NAD(P)/FAD-dependent oxidoreductase [Paenibacillus tepidiphilus]|uniref:NAD(P)/FAD-dependent oxidoreductase n=1 Tax=Paenibacillus tepidiphilus TaxID=2608683 RepID=UPI00123BE36B|nr:NAD(P)/FAD-dependent oxidoreductase [Paenibacillus tepidiphilus]